MQHNHLSHQSFHSLSHSCLPVSPGASRCVQISILTVFSNLRSLNMAEQINQKQDGSFGEQRDKTKLSQTACWHIKEQHGISNSLRIFAVDCSTFGHGGKVLQSSQGKIKNCIFLLACLVKYESQGLNNVNSQPGWWQK